MIIVMKPNTEQENHIQIINCWTFIASISMKRETPASLESWFTEISFQATKRNEVYSQRNVEQGAWYECIIYVNQPDIII